jgi:hypothetical protein
MASQLRPKREADCIQVLMAQSIDLARRVPMGIVSWWNNLQCSWIQLGVFCADLGPCRFLLSRESNYPFLHSIGKTIEPFAGALLRFSLSALVLAPSLTIGPKKYSSFSEREPAVTTELALNALITGAWRTLGYFSQMMAVQKTENLSQVALFGVLSVVLVPFVIHICPSLKPELAKPKWHSWLAAIVAVIGAIITNFDGGTFRFQLENMFSGLQVLGFSMGVSPYQTSERDDVPFHSNCVRRALILVFYMYGIGCHLVLFLEVHFE